MGVIMCVFVSIVVHARLCVCVCVCYACDDYAPAAYACVCTRVCFINYFFSRRIQRNLCSLLERECAILPLHKTKHLC